MECFCDFCDDVHFGVHPSPKVTQVHTRNRDLRKFQLSSSEPLCTEVLPYMTWMANPRWERFVFGYDVKYSFNSYNIQGDKIIWGHWGGARFPALCMGESPRILHCLDLVSFGESILRCTRWPGGISRGRRASWRRRRGRGCSRPDPRRPRCSRWASSSAGSAGRRFNRKNLAWVSAWKTDWDSVLITRHV